MSLDNINALDLLDATLDDLADLKKFEPMPVGSYQQRIKWSFPESNEFVEVRLDLETVTCLDVPGVSEEELPKEGALATFYFRLQRKDGQPMVFEKSGEVNDIDQGRFKEVLLALAPVFNPDGTLSNRQMIEATQGVEVLTSLGQRKNKNDPDQKFQVLKKIVLADS